MEDRLRVIWSDLDEEESENKDTKTLKEWLIFLDNEEKHCYCIAYTTYTTKHRLICTVKKKNSGNVGMTVDW